MPHPLTDENISKDRRRKKGQKIKKKDRETVALKKHVEKLKQRKRLDAGTIIHTSAGKQFEILTILGSGGFGDVYKVQEAENKELFAMKTETIVDDLRLNRLKIEMSVFKMIDEASDERRKHFAKMVDKGITNGMRFIVMELVGKSLEALLKATSKIQFTLGTAISLCYQSLEALDDLHSLGYIHRDIKPQNFAMGLGDNSRTVYLLDFGIAKRYVDDSKNIRIPREAVRFIGTLKYSSRAAHHLMEQGRKDDIETWFYMLLELTDRRVITWNCLKEPQRVVLAKEELFSGTNAAWSDLPEPYQRIKNYINEMSYETCPDIAYIKKMLQFALKAKNLKLNDRFDWEAKDKGTKKDELREMTTESSESAEMDNDSAKKKERKKESKKKDDRKTTKASRKTGLKRKSQLKDRDKESLKKSATKRTRRNRTVDAGSDSSKSPSSPGGAKRNRRKTKDTVTAEPDEPGPQEGGEKAEKEKEAEEKEKEPTKDELGKYFGGAKDKQFDKGRLNMDEIRRICE